MEVSQRKDSRRKHPANTTALREVIVRRWQDLGQPPVDAQLLTSIQEHVGDRFAGEVISPASIARLLGDAGAELRHPGIIEIDAAWREKQIETHAQNFADLEQFVARSPMSLEQAREFITRLADRRKELDRQGDDAGVAALTRIAIEARQSAQAMGANVRLDATVRAEQSEIAEWLKVWLQTPALFNDWVDLRRRSEEFQRRFGAEAP